MKREIKNEYNPDEIENHWQKEWENTNLYKTREDMSLPKYYILDMFPYPSGEGLHVGHPKGYIATDVITRMKVMQGYNVLHAMGWDAFGLPAENYAIKNKIHPSVAVKENIAKFKSQLRRLGLTYDWNKEINTTDPNYYKWTQWIFLKLHEKGLAYESNEPINWCPSCQTGLANEDLENGNCERCGTHVEKKLMRQWVLKITEYADRLLDDLDKLPEWEESVKEMQRNWIGRKKGALISFDLLISETSSKNHKIKVFTTRPETIFGSSFIVISPEHPLVSELTNNIENQEEVSRYVYEAGQKSDLDRTDLNVNKTGVLLEGIKAINPINKKEIPVYLADYVLKSYGTGAIMGVPAHDQRDFDFALLYNLPVIPVIKPKSIRLEDLKLPFIGDGEVMGSEFVTGLSSPKASEEVIKWLEKNNLGGKFITYKLQDWVFSRQRYWGEPIPIVRCKKCGIVPIPENELPLKLPDIKNYQPTGTGESPLVDIKEWFNTKCPRCSGLAKRETNTMPQWAGSSWYWLRYIDPHNNKMLVDKKKEGYWSPVDQYIGGAEHATRHLIYARFWYKFLYDIGVVNYEEPFKGFQHVGLIMGEDGQKMSKRFGNVVSPDDIVEQYGADTLRVYEMFMGQFGYSTAWNTKGLVGARRFLGRVFDLQRKLQPTVSTGHTSDLERLVHKTIRGVTKDIEHFKFNTAISKLMELINKMSDENVVNTEDYKKLILLLHPFAPHITEELWNRTGEKYSIYTHCWPKYEESKIQETSYNIGIQIDGKIRGELTIDKTMEREELKTAVLKVEKIQKHLEGKEIVDFIYIPRKIVNLVTRKI